MNLSGYSKRRSTKEAALRKGRDYRMKADTICCYCILCKQAHDKRGIEESLHVGLDCVRWTYFQEKYHGSQKYAHPLLNITVCTVAYI